MNREALALMETYQTYNCFDMYPVKVTIGDKVYNGIHYKQTLTLSPGMPAYTKAMAAGEPLEYEVEAWAMFGNIVVESKRRNPKSLYERCVFVQGDTHYYIVCCSANPPGDDAPSLFQIRIWDTKEMGEIDAHEEKKYKRVPISIERE